MKKLASCVLGGPIPLGHTWLYISAFERQGVGLQWENLWEGCTSKDELSVGVMIVAMLVTGTVHMLLAFYIELAFPGQYGVRLPWYFPFTVMKLNSFGVSNFSLHFSVTCFCLP